MSKKPEKAEQPLSIEEQQAMLEGADPSAMPKIPESAIVMEDQDPERFKAMMEEGGGESSMQEMLMQAIRDIPDRVADSLREG